MQSDFFPGHFCLSNLFLNFRRRAETVKGRGPESVRRGSRDNNAAPTPEFDSQVDVSLQVKFIAREDMAT